MLKTVPEHLRSDGRDVIDALADLGAALGYKVEREWPLPMGTGAIDVVWLRDPLDTAPLFAFEVESRAGEGLASNAMKILGRSASEGAKPLHLFHVVVRGGVRSRRPIDTAREFAGHNYTVHLLGRANEPAELLKAILGAHRRVTTAIDGITVGKALRAPLWSDMTADAVVRGIEDAGLEGVRGRPVVALALHDSDFRCALERHLIETWRGVFQGDRPAPNRYLGASGHPFATYGSYMAEAACEGLELGLIARLLPEHGVHAFRALQQWQAANHIGDCVGPFTGAGTQWTQYAMNHLGYYWALLAALFTEVDGARSWCATQPLKLVQALPAGGYRALLALWVMHALPDGSQYRSTYEDAALAVRDIGGVASGWIARPSPAGPDPEYAEEDEWTPILGDGTGLVPTPDGLRRLVRSSGVDPTDPVELALTALLEDPALRPAEGAALAAVLATAPSAPPSAG